MAPVPSTSASSAFSGSTSSAGSSKIAKFVDENRTILLASGAAISLGVAYYFLIGPGSKPAGSAKGGDASASSAQDKASSSSKKRKHGKKKKAGAAGTSSDAPHQDGPILEEATDEQLFDLSEDEIRRLPEERRKSLAQAFKVAGNKKYQARQFEEATYLYTKALAAEEQAVFYSNRAACYSNRGDYEKVIEDCDKALSLDKAYIKALNRRAIAREALGKNPEEGEAGERKRELLNQALTDFTAVAILGQFKNEEATASVERVLKQLAEAQAKEIIRTREPKLPSSTFITAYLDAFRRKDAPTLPTDREPTEGDKLLIEAYRAIAQKEYTLANTKLNLAIEAGLSGSDFEAHAYNMRGTFKFIIGDAPGALEDLNRSTELKPNYVQSWVKKASVLMELSDKDEAFRVFDRAVAEDGSDPDIYYHRGQVYYIMGDYDAACEDYLKSTSLDDSFIFSQVQYAVAQYKMSNVERSTQSFQKVLRKFSSSSEAYNYYGELLLDQGRYEDAIAKFDRGIEIEASNPGSSNVLPMINKALAVFQWKQDLPAAEQLCKRALEIDPDCDMAIATLAQLSLQQGRIRDAIEHFAKSAQMARTENELINAITYEYASRAQLEFIESFPDIGPTLPHLASAMA
ncbi:TOM (translocase of outer membrane) complex component [Tilletia horrida]|uniref:TOM (Translocase of outer membrane) complex component n=1 Tax=Tilletia horrida TaxID=155126 RepID=A0AAN6GRU0_9BASI|nr:TOM (translocase of outer membrane) complex component [Tilletia horrida]KAK0554105.1 TOM (translocase of outer membrane) complex component [Tilletia horrida]